MYIMSTNYFFPELQFHLVMHGISSRLSLSNSGGSDAAGGNSGSVIKNKAGGSLTVLTAQVKIAKYSWY